MDKMPEAQRRQRVLKIAWSYYGAWYKWGGDDPSGFDCSGLVIECLKATGDLPRKGDWTAQMLFDKFAVVPHDQARGGDLVFWSNSAGHIIHVEIVLDQWTSMGASGGGSRTRSTLVEYKLLADDRIVPVETDAMKQNAYIKSRPIYSRPGVHGFCNPYTNGESS